MDAPFYITVILPLKLAWEPFYSCSDSSVRRGSRVSVRFNGKEYTGVADSIGVPLPDGLKPEKVQPIIMAVNLPEISAEELELWHFIADYYMCTVGEVYKAAYPALRIAEEKSLARAMERAEEKRRKLDEALAAKRSKLQDRLAKAELELSSARPGTKKEAMLRKKVEKIQRQLEASHIDAGGKMAACAGQTASDTITPEAGPDGGLAETGIRAPETAIALSADQLQAKQEITSLLSSGKPALLHGVTGSGKTEIYLTIALDTLNKGRNVLYMVPEIALSRQIESRLRTVFGDMLLVSHSGESTLRRREVARLMKTSRYILLGTRSSVFLPHRNLGLVVIDEEHDRSYKQDEPAPRYNGRDTAAKLASIHRAALVLGSATPSMESLYNCMTGRYGIVNLNRKYYGGEGAPIEIIDTRAERRKNGMKGHFSIKLIGHINKALSRGEQVMILRARRSYAPSVQCGNCGEIVKCPSCNVPLSLHMGAEPRLVCHWCGHSEPYSGICPGCGGKTVPLGAGTQRIEEEAKELFPEARIARLDADSSSGAKQIIEDFADGRTDILIGTQIVAKGFDFKNLALVAVLQSDGLLGQQDFRADERAVQLLEQLRGRCSRRGGDGLFVIQTASPEHPVYSVLTGNGDFIAGQMKERGAFGFPPYTRLIVLALKDIYEDRLERMAAGLSRGIAAAFGTVPSLIFSGDTRSIHVSMPYPPPVDKVSGQYIRHIRVVLKRGPHLAGDKAAIREALVQFENRNSWHDHTTIDVDPL